MADGIILVGLGPGGRDEITVGGLRALREARLVLLRTERHPTAALLRDEGITWESFDDMYETAEDFPGLYLAMAHRVIERARGGAGVAYAVPGHPDCAEASVPMVRRLAAEKGITVATRGAPSFIDAVCERLAVDPLDGLQVVDGLALDQTELNPCLGLLVGQVYNDRIAAAAKLALMKAYPPNFPVTVIRAAGVEGQERACTVPLFQLDRRDFDHLCTLYLGALTRGRSVPGLDGDGGQGRALQTLTGLVQRLRGPAGCPWDRAQDPSSLRPYVLEEAAEVVAAVESGEAHKLQEELGDLLLQVVLLSTCAREAGQFDLGDVVRTLTEKLIRRHPHVFGEVQAEDASQAVATWEGIKAAERRAATGVKDGASGSPMDDLPALATLPALMLAEQVQRRAARVGFDWPGPGPVFDKVREELGEFSDALAAGGRSALEAEAGDLLFAAVNLVRLAGVKAEIALRDAADRFVARFRHMEDQAAQEGRRLQDYSLSGLDGLWDVAKAELEG